MSNDKPINPYILAEGNLLASKYLDYYIEEMIAKKALRQKEKLARKTNPYLRQGAQYLGHGVIGGWTGRSSSDDY
jgi:hypothetical protein